MPVWLKRLYTNYIFKHSWLAAIVIIAVIVSIASFSVDFRMDASGDSLVLENDESLEYYRKVKKKYGTDD